MTTRLELRTSVRRRLEDTGATPLWDDATLNDLLANAIRRYGARFPAERVATVAVTTGAISTPVTPVMETDEVARVFDPAGELVPRIQSMLNDFRGASGQAWRWWNGELLLAQPANGGDWRIEYRAARQLPDDDADLLDITPGDEEILTLMVCASALRRRTIEDGKRGLSRGVEGIAITADRLEAEVESHISARRRRVRGGWFG